MGFPRPYSNHEDFGMKRIFLGALAGGAILFLLIQFIRPSIPDLPAAAEINAP